MENLAHNPEIEQTRRLRILLKPLVVEADNDPYIHQRNLTDDGRKLTPKEVQNIHMQNKARNERATVTPESLEDAKLNLGTVLSEPRIEQIMVEYCRDNPEIETGIDIMRALREDPELRFTIGKELIEQVDKNYLLALDPKHILKKPGHAYSIEQSVSMTSREYVALLVLAKIDGSFKAKNQSEIYMNNGEHRTLADEFITALVA